MTPYLYKHYLTHILVRKFCIYGFIVYICGVIKKNNMETISISSLTPNDVVVKSVYHHFSEASYKRLVSSLSKKAHKEHCFIYFSVRPAPDIHMSWKEIRLFYPRFDADGNIYFEILLHTCYLRPII